MHTIEEAKAIIRKAWGDADELPSNGRVRNRDTTTSMDGIQRQIDEAIAGGFSQCMFYYMTERPAGQLNIERIAVDLQQNELVIRPFA